MEDRNHFVSQGIGIISSIILLKDNMEIEPIIPTELKSNMNPKGTLDNYL